VKIIQLAQSGTYVKYSEIHIDEDISDNLVEKIPDEQLSPQRMLEGQEGYEEMMACLTVRQREYVALLMQGYKYAEIAKEMNVTYSYLRNMWMRIRSRLRAHGYGLPTKGK
jgi:DNA-binding CsgD family transcriptional regulator